MWFRETSSKLSTEGSQQLMMSLVHCCSKWKMEIEVMVPKFSMDAYCKNDRFPVSNGELRECLLHELNTSIFGEHSGILNTSMIPWVFIWLGLKKNVFKTIQACDVCQWNKVDSRQRGGFFCTIAHSRACIDQYFHYFVTSYLVHREMIFFSWWLADCQSHPYSVEDITRSLFITWLSYIEF